MNFPVMSDRPCCRCHGLGTEIDQKATARKSRRLRGDLSRRELAKLMGISEGYLGDLENGRREWTGEMISKFLKATNGQ